MLLVGSFNLWGMKECIFVECIFFAPDVGFHYWLAGGAVKNVWANILILKRIVLGFLVIYSVSDININLYKLT